MGAPRILGERAVDATHGQFTSNRLIRRSYPALIDHCPRSAHRRLDVSRALRRADGAGRGLSTDASAIGNIDCRTYSDLSHRIHLWGYFARTCLACLVSFSDCHRDYLPVFRVDTSYQSNETSGGIVDDKQYGRKLGQHHCGAEFGGDGSRKRTLRRTKRRILFTGTLRDCGLGDRCCIGRYLLELFVDLLGSRRCPQRDRRSSDPR